MHSTSSEDLEFERKLRADFLTEAEELLSKVEGLFLDLEKNPAHTAAVDQIFRIIHTIKGSGAVAGFAALAAFAHTFENLLGKIRAGDIKSNRAIIDVLLAGNDVLNTFISRLKQDQAAVVDADDVLRRIEMVMSPPSADAAPVQATTPAQVNEIAPAKPEAQTVLLVDDEDAIVEYLAELFTEFGYAVLTANSGTEALQILDKHPHIDLVISDQKMPGMTGSKLVEAIKQRNIDLPIIIVSGASEWEDMIKFIGLGVFDFLEKPVEWERLKITSDNAIQASQMKSCLRDLSKLTASSYFTLRKMLLHLDEQNLSPEARNTISRYTSYVEKMGTMLTTALGHTPKKAG